MPGNSRSRRCQVGLLPDDRSVTPAHIRCPRWLPLEKCYRLDSHRRNSNPADAANNHLLAVFGKFDRPFLPVRMPKDCDENLLTAVPAITHVQVAFGKTIHKARVGQGTLTCVESITITVRTSDGRAYSSPVPMAVPRYGVGDASGPYSLCVALDAFKGRRFDAAWYHLSPKRHRLRPPSATAGSHLSRKPGSQN